MRYSEDLIEEIRMKNDIVDVISGYVKLQKRGATYFGLCPFHNEKTPSFSVTPRKQMYYCFGCGAGGNVFTFIMNYENFTFFEALKFLADRVGVALPEMEYSEEAKKKADIKSSILEINKQAANYYYYQLKSENGKQAYDYLRNRELTDETIKRFGLGASSKYSGDLYKFLKGKGYSDKLLMETGLFKADETRGITDRFWNRVIFPILDVNNRVIGFGGRVMGDGEPKYLNSPETKAFDKSRNLYGLNFARTSRRPNLIICEGYMDVIALHQAGFTNAVASLGTAFTSQQSSLIKRYAEEVLLTYDSDGAGVKAALRAIPILKESGLSVKVINMRPYKDPDEFIKNLGPEAFEERIRNASNAFFYELEVMEQQYNMKDPEEKTSFYNVIARKLLDFPEEIERNNYIEAVAVKYHMGYENLRNLVNQLAIRLGPKRESEKPKSGMNRNKEKEDGAKQAQKLLLTWLIEDPRLFDYIKTYISPGDFVEPIYHSVADQLFLQHENGDINPAKIINSFQAEEEHKEVAGLFNARLDQVETKEEREKALKDIVFRVKQNSAESITKNLDPTDIMGLQKVITMKRELQNLEKLHISIDWE